jgi:hypothetical protein
MKFVKSMLVFCAVTVLVGGSPGAALAGNLVQNGDFSEYTNFTPTDTIPYTIFSPKLNSNIVVAHWTVSFNGDNNGINWLVTPSSDNKAPIYNATGAPGGTNYVSLDGGYNYTSMQQEIEGLTPGVTYTLDFDYSYGQQLGQNGGRNNGYIVNFGGNFVSIDQPHYYGSHEFSGWFHKTVDVVATGTSDKLTFFATGNPNVPPMTQFANISLEAPASVPEPSSLGLGCTALVFAGIYSLRRRAQLANV